MRYVIIWSIALPLVVLAVMPWAAQSSVAADALSPASQLLDGDVLYEILEDPAGVLQLEDVLAPTVAARFAPPDSVPFLHPFTRTTYWLRLDLPVTETAATWLVELANPIPAYVSFYVLGPDDQVLKTVQTGAYLPFSARDVPHPNFVFDVDLPPGSAQTVVMRLALESAASLSLHLWSPVGFASTDAMRQFLWGAAYGTLLIMALYHLNLFLTLRQRSYLFLALYVLASCMTYAVIDGRGHRYLWPNHGAAVIYATPISIGLVVVFLLLLTTSFLDTRTHAPKTHAALLALLLVHTLALLALAWGDPLAILEIQFYLLIPALVAVLIASILVLRTGYTPARYFTVAQAVPLFVGLVPIIAALAGRPYSPILRELSIPGNILMVVFTSFALADRITFLQRENRLTAQALDTSERRLVEYLEAIPVGIAVYTSNLQLVYANQAALHLADQPDGRQTVSLEEATATYQFYESGSDRPYPLERLPLMQALQGRAASVDDVEIATPFHRYPAAMWATPVTNPAGVVEYAVCAFQDISTIRAAERAALEAQTLYRQVVEDQPAFICRFLPGGHIRFANSAFTNFAGITSAQVDETSIFGLIEEQDAAEFRADIARLDTSRQVQTLETRMRNRRGQTAWVQWTTRALFDAQDRLVEYQALGLDVTKAKMAELELAQYRNQLEDLVAARTVALSRANDDLRRRAEELATLNAITRTLASTTELSVVLPEILVQLARVTHFDEALIYLRQGPWLTIAESVGPNAHAAPAQLALSDAQNAIVQVFTEQRTLVTGRSTARHIGTTDGNGEAASWVGTPLLVGNEPIGVLAVTAAGTDAYGADDVRNLRAFADQAAVAVLNARLHQQAQVVAVSRERERLARDLHDAVTQTLFSASIMAEAVPQQWQVDPEGAVVTLDKLRHMTRGALAEMRSLLWELRPGEVEATPLGTLLRHLGEALTGNTMVPVFVSCTPPDLLLPGDVQLAFYRITQEALNNVAKHSDATSVEIVARADGDRCTLHIRDDGRGFDTALIDPGHLGLSIMRERMEAIGGTLEVISKPGHGSQIVARWHRPEGTTT